MVYSFPFLLAGVRACVCVCVFYPSFFNCLLKFWTLINCHLQFFFLKYSCFSEIERVLIGYAEDFLKEVVDCGKRWYFGSMGGFGLAVFCLSLKVLVGFFLILAIHMVDGANPKDGKARWLLNLFFLVF